MNKDDTETEETVEEPAGEETAADDTPADPADEAADTAAADAGEGEAAEAASSDEAADAAASDDEAADTAAEASEDDAEGEEGTDVNTDYHSNRAFSDFPLSGEVLQGIEELGYTVATAVQAASLEAALAHVQRARNILVLSGAGMSTAAGRVFPGNGRDGYNRRKPLATGTAGLSLSCHDYFSQGM